MAYCLAPQPRLVCAEYFQSTLVVTATLIKTTTIPQNDPDVPVAWTYTLRVNRTFRGEAPATVQVYEENSSSRAGFTWVNGQEYLLFLNYDRDDHTIWELDGCGNSGPITRRRAALSAVRAIQKTRDSMIQGVVGGRGQPLFSGLHVEAMGASGRFTAITDKNGEFRMRVPPGRYRVNVVEAGRYFDDLPLGLTYSDIDDPLEAGGCAQVQFDELPSPPGP
jgi:hypothetical protein